MKLHAVRSVILHELRIFAWSPHATISCHGPACQRRASVAYRGPWVAAAATALLLGLFAHDAIGMPIDTIRIKRDISRTSILHISTYQRTSTWPSSFI